MVASFYEVRLLVAEDVVHGPEERLHHLRVARAVRVGERVEIRGCYAAHPRQLRRVYLRDVHDLVEAEQVQELREHQQVRLGALRELPRLDLLARCDLLDLPSRYVFLHNLCET